MILVFFINFAYTYALLMILSICMQSKMWQYALCFLILIGKPFFLPIPFPSWNLMIDCIVCWILLNNRRQKLFLSFYYVLSIIFYFVIFYAIASSVFTLIAHDFRQSNGYEYMIMIVFFIGATALKLFCPSPRKKRNYRVLALETLMKLLILIGSATLSYWFRELNDRTFAWLIVFVVLLLSIMLYTFHIFNQQQMKIQIDRLEQSQNEEIKRAYQRVVAFEHMYHDFAQIAYRLLKKKDYDELHVLLEEHVLPMLEINDYKKELKKIQNSMIREQVSLVIHNAALLENVNLRFSINQNINFNRQNKRAVFKLLSEFCNNAFKSIQNQSDALLVIEFMQVNQNCQITIANSIDDERAIQSLYQFTSNHEKNSGYGRKLIAEIVEQSSSIEQSESINQDCFSGQTMFTQIICITGENR